MATIYRVANGNWNDADSWAGSSGGTDYVSTPTASDDVIFDASTPAGTHTVNIVSAVKTLNMTGFTGTLNGSSAITLSGSLTWGASMTNSHTGSLTFIESATITSNGVTTREAINFATAGKTYELGDDLVLYAGSDLNFTAGTFNTNNNNVTARFFNISSSNARTLTSGSSTITCGNRFDATIATNLTYDFSSTDLICASNFYGGGLTFQNLTINQSGTATFSFTGANTFGDLTINGGYNAVGHIKFSANQTVTGTFTATAQSAANRYSLMSDTIGTARTITAGTVSITNINFMDITGAGTGTWSGTSIGDAGGNTGISFAGAVTRYWIGGAGNFNATAEWSASSGGAGGETAPLPQDTAIFDANSFASDGLTVAMTDLFMPNVDMSATDQTFNMTITPLDLYFSGGAVLDTNLTLTGNNRDLIFVSRSNVNFDPAGAALNFNGVYLENVGATITLTGELVMSGATYCVLYINKGTLDANDQDITVKKIYTSNSDTRAFVMGSGTITMTASGAGASAPFNASNATGLTITPETSTMLFTADGAISYFYGGGKTFYNLAYSGNNTFRIADTGNTFNVLTVDSDGGANNLELLAGSTTNVSSLVATGSSGKVITIDSTSSTNATINDTSGTNTVDYVYIENVNASGGADFYYLANSTIVGDSTGWVLRRYYSFNDTDYTFNETDYTFNQE